MDIKLPKSRRKYATTIRATTGSGRVQVPATAQVLLHDGIDNYETITCETWEMLEQCPPKVLFTKGITKCNVFKKELREFITEVYHPNFKDVTVWFNRGNDTFVDLKRNTSKLKYMSIGVQIAFLWKLHSEFDASNHTYFIDFLKQDKLYGSRNAEEYDEWESLIMGRHSRERKSIGPKITKIQ